MNVIAYLHDINTEEKMISLIFNNLFYYQNLDTSYKIDCASADIYNWFVQECVQNNQYLFISDELYASIFELYRALILKLKEIHIDQKDINQNIITDIVRQHRTNLISTLSSVAEIDFDTSQIIPCSEYSVDLQMHILRLNITSIKEPVLDIGCGKDHPLLTKFALLGIDTYGIDQYRSPDKRIICKNWLDFDYVNYSWGTIISHMAFTNHYRRNLTRKTELLSIYKTIFKNILNSLKIGGKFVYTPSLQEIESDIDTKYFDISHFTNIPGNNFLDTTQIIRKM